MNKKALFAFPILVCCLTSCVGKTHYQSFKYRTAVEWKNTAEDFKILQLCDIHFNQADYLDRHFKLMDLTISDSNADLIVLNGDSFTFADKSVVVKLFSFIDSYDIPWTFTFGNHDDQGYFADTYIQRLLQDNSLFKNVKFINLEDDDVTGRSNFVIDIFQNNGIKDITKFQVYCLESHNYNFDSLGYDFIKQDQIDWYERMVKDSTESNEGVTIPSAMYFHIALPEFIEAWNEVTGEVENKHNSHKPTSEEFINGENASIGEYGGPIPEIDTHLFDKVKELGSTLAISCAHDHINDAIIIYDDIALCYGVHSTNRIYYDDAKIGGQVISVDASDPTKLTFENIYHSYSEVEDK